MKRNPIQMDQFQLLFIKQNYRTLLHFARVF
jgi:hypothetical protein